MQKDVLWASPLPNIAAFRKCTLERVVILRSLRNTNLYEFCVHIKHCRLYPRSPITIGVSNMCHLYYYSKDYDDHYFWWKWSGFMLVTPLYGVRAMPLWNFRPRALAWLAAPLTLSCGPARGLEPANKALRSSLVPMSHGDGTYKILFQSDEIYDMYTQSPNDMDINEINNIYNYERIMEHFWTGTWA